MKQTILLSLTFLCILFTDATAQEQQKEKAQSFVEIGYGIGKDASRLSAGYYRSWKLSQEKKILKNFSIGTGLRFGGFSAKDIYFTSAPSSLYKTNSADSILAPAPAIYSVNAFLNLNYQITSKIQAGFDIDLIGLSFGPNGSPTFISNGQSQITKVNPTPINLLLINANNRGSLLSNIYVRYQITNRWGGRISYQKSYTEISTEQLLQTIPEDNKRFRYVTGLVGLGVSYHFL